MLAQGFQEMVYFANVERLATALGIGAYVCVCVDSVFFPLGQNPRMMHTFSNEDFNGKLLRYLATNF